jgi:hypothetical protein
MGPAIFNTNIGAYADAHNLERTIHKQREWAFDMIPDLLLSLQKDEMRKGQTPEKVSEEIDTQL